MDLLTTSKQKIEELNNRFFYIMEDFIPKYINYLRDPKNNNHKSEINRIDGVIANINSEAHILQNHLQLGINENDKKIIKMNQDISALKDENKDMKSRINNLHNQSVTSVGLYDTELDWYKKQMLIILLLLIGIIFSIRLLTGLHMSWLQVAIPVCLFIIMKMIYGFMFRS
jgi:hypothetical protein